MQIKNICNALKSIWTKFSTTDSKITDLEEKTESSGWVTATLDNQFKPYNDTVANTPRYRKDGNRVIVEGIVSPTSEITGSNTTYTIFTLPTGYRPSNKNLYCLCQGSNRAIWLLTVATSGTVSFSRYGTSEYQTATTSAWLPFTFDFVVD